MSTVLVYWYGLRYLVYTNAIKKTKVSPLNEIQPG